MKIEVTSEDISEGYSGSYSHCPVALAMKRACKRDDLSVGINCWWYEGEHIGRYLPYNVRKFILYFDRGNRRVEPFAFELETNQCPI